MGLTNDIAAGKARDQVRLLADIAGLTPTSLTRSLLAQRVVDVATRRFSDICAVHALDAEGSLVLEAIADSRERVSARAEKAFALTLASHDGFIQAAMRSGQPLLFARKAGRATLVEESAARLLQFTATRSLAVVPLSIGSTCVGTLSFLESRHAAAYDVSDLECAHAVGRQLSVAFENIQYREHEQRIAGRARFLARATDQFFATAEPDEMLQLLLNVIVEEFADWAFAVMLGDAKLEVIATAESDTVSQPQGRVFSETSENALIAAVRGQRPLLVNEIMRSPAASAAESLDFEPRAWMMAPLFLGAKRGGGVVCYSTARRYDDADLEMLQELCRRTGLALEYAEGFARERRLTQTLQQATLPANLADVPNATLSAAYIPAAQEEQVGG
ncbi:MAG: GAF domain-containing protein, partial [Candidatus Eremiobacteraeota bacterium]|nr:GAF domain-containing protein [Candidatus Eremiobacteraeota bacterium]